MKSTKRGVLIDPEPLLPDAAIACCVVGYGPGAGREPASRSSLVITNVSLNAPHLVRGASELDCAVRRDEASPVDSAGGCRA